jgi:hypothetical protein
MTICPATELAWAPLAQVDPELWQALRREHARQRHKIELIASEFSNSTRLPILIRTGYVTVQPHDARFKPVPGRRSAKEPGNSTQRKDVPDSCALSSVFL